MSTRLPHATSEEPFEPRVTSYGGRGLFATKSIPAGTLLRTCPAPYASAIYAPFRKEVCAHCFAYAFDAGKNAWNVKHDASPASRFCSEVCMQSWAGEHDSSLVARVEKAVQALARSSLNVKRPVVVPVIALDGAATDITMQDLDEAWQAAEKTDVKAGAIVLDEMEEEIMRFVLSAILHKYYEDTAAAEKDANGTEESASAARSSAFAARSSASAAGSSAPTGSSAPSAIATSALTIPTTPAGPFSAFLELQDNELQHVRTNPAILPAHIRVWLFLRLAVMGVPGRGGRGSRDSSASGSRARSSQRSSPARELQASPSRDSKRTFPARTSPERQNLATIPELLPYLSTPTLLRAILARDHANAFGIFDMQEKGESEMLGWAVYVAGSYFNHDCAPNVRKIRRGRALQFVTMRDVALGEELCITYVDVQDTKASRAAQFAQHWNFVCGCARCRGEKVDGYEIEGDADSGKQAQQGSLTRTPTPTLPPPVSSHERPQTGGKQENA
ncbi:SET domain-containing protein [Schizophyllum commune Loenen D]|nr:SET domain-containing protein [Schizophyllum commune Loenen D]